MESDKNYLAVGIFVLLTMLGTIAFAIWMVGPRDKTKYLQYRIRFAESVAGLDVGGAVKFRGVNVGKVDEISIDPQDSRRIRVDVSILRTTPIKTDTVASLKLQGITGVVFVELSGGERGQDLKAKDTDDADALPEIRAETSSINTILNVLPDILQKVSNIADQFGKIFSDDNVSTISKMVNDWGNISAALQAQTGDLKRLLENSNAVASDMHDVIRDSRADIKQVMDNLEKTTTQMNELLKRTNDSAGGQYQSLYQLVDELKHTSREIGSLAKSLNQDPSQIIHPPQEKGIPAP